MGLGEFLFGKDVEKPEMPEPMDYSTAMMQAENILNPQYQQQLDQTIEKINNQNVSRGFYGQATGDAIKQGATADLAAKHGANIAQQAMNIRQQNFQNDLATYQQEMKRYKNESQGLLENNNFWGTVGTIAGSFLGGPAGAAIGSSIASNFGSSNNQDTNNYTNYSRAGGPYRKFTY